jgi:hypothetical protein
MTVIVDKEKMIVHEGGSVELRLEALLEMLRKQSDVELDATPYLKKRKVGIGEVIAGGLLKHPQNLREHMASSWVTDRLQAWWVPRGKGYFLTQGEEMDKLMDIEPKKPGP